MEPAYKSSPRVHVIRIVLTLAGLLIAGSLARQALLPDDFGEYGRYRPAAVEEEAARLARNMTNGSCLDCHPLIRDIHQKGVHQTVSCEFCHGAFADHVKDNLVVGIMPVVRGQDIKPLCLRCHRKVMRAIEPDSIKVVALPEHLEARKVGTHHICNQCHHVHDPMKWVNEAREMVGLTKNEEERGSWKN